MASANRRNVQAPPAFDRDFKPEAGDDTVVIIINATNNIIELPIKGDDGKFAIIGAAVDRGIVKAAQPEYATTAGAVRRARMNPAVDMMFSGTKPALELRGRIYTTGG